VQIGDVSYTLLWFPFKYWLYKAVIGCMAQVACLSELETLSSNPSTANKKTPGVVCVSGELGVWRCPNCLGDSPLLSSPVLSSPLLFSLFFLTRASYCGHGMPPDHTIPHCSACPGLSPATLWGDGLSCPSHGGRGPFGVYSRDVSHLD
jgi:hypothetical protein